LDIIKNNKEKIEEINSEYKKYSEELDLLKKEQDAFMHDLFLEMEKAKMDEIRNKL
jgi:flagellar hook-basal body complex protein FliE